MSFDGIELDFALEVAKRAVEAEREACANVCDAHARGWEMNPGNNPAAGFIASSNCASNIRERYNVELTGAAQLYRAASSDRRERG
jgi:hypothetical protein